MKCIYCEVDSKYKDRTGGHCPKCGHDFAFEPKNGDPFTDGLFKRAIDTVSSDGRVRWGVEHLYYEVRRRAYKNTKLTALILVVIAPCAFLVLNGMGLPFPMSAIFSVFLLFIAMAAAFSSRVHLEQGQFESRWQRWCKVHGRPKGVITRREQPQSPRTVESDVADYSFDRAVICDRARTVDLLLANNFHFENNCAILSIEGYPPGPFETVRKMLQRNPNLQVFALHDATPDGCRLAHRLTTEPHWFADRGNTVIDVGLRPAHAGPFYKVLNPSVGETLAGKGISDAEALWLSKHSLELAAVRPEQVLKRLFRAINRKFDPQEATSVADGGSGGDGGSSYVETDSTSFGSDACDGEGGADSFG